MTGNVGMIWKRPKKPLMHKLNIRVEERFMMLIDEAAKKQKISISKYIAEIIDPVLKKRFDD